MTLCNSWDSLYGICFDLSMLGWLGGEVKVTKKKVQMIFLPLMVLGNESPKEF